MKKLLNIFLLIPTLCMADSEPYSYKGIKLGDSFSYVESLSMDCRKPIKTTDKFDYICSSTKDSFTFAEQPANISVVGSDGVITTILIKIDSKSYDLAKLALTEKFGSPNRTATNILTNGFGVEFNSEEVAWENSKSVIQLTQLSKNINTTTINYTLQSSIDKVIKDKPAKIKKLANDI